MTTIEEIYLEKEETMCYFPNWNILPENIVIELYTYLKDRDRANMALTCKRWSHLFDTPALWKHRRVILRGFKTRQIIESFCTFLSRHGRCLKRLTLVCGKTTFHSSHCLGKCLDKLFNALGSSCSLKLETLNLHKFDIRHKWRFHRVRYPHTVHNMLVRTLCSFLTRAKHLKSVDLTNMRLSPPDGCRLLEALAKRQTRHLLKVIHIQDLFAEKIIPIKERRFCNLFTKFTNLSHIFINYVYLSGDILNKMAEALTHNLSYMMLSMNSDDPKVTPISDSAWSHFTRRCPSVYIGVSYRFEDEINLDYFRSLFVQTFPLCGIDFVQIEDDEDGIGLGGNRYYSVAAGMVHLAKLLNRRMEYIGAVVSQYQDIDAGLLLLLSKCSNLKEIMINARLSIETIKTICQSQIGTPQPSLRAVSMSIYGLTEEDMRMLEEIQENLRREIIQQGDTVEININEVL